MDSSSDSDLDREEDKNAFRSPVTTNKDRRVTFQRSTAVGVGGKA